MAVLMPLFAGIARADSAPDWFKQDYRSPAEWGLAIAGGDEAVEEKALRRRPGAMRD